MMKRRRLLMTVGNESGSGEAKLPAGYTRLDYLQTVGDSSGGDDSGKSQYIDTGVVPRTYGGVGIKIYNFNILEYVSKQYNRNVFFGAAEHFSTGSQSFCACYVGSAGAIYANINGSDYNTGITHYPNDSSFTLETGISESAWFFKKNDILTTGTCNYSTPTHRSIWINGANQGGYPFNSSIQFGETIITAAPVTNGTLEGAEVLRHFIPALDLNNRPCLYDTITKQPFYNQGTGEFLYG